MRTEPSIFSQRSGLPQPPAGGCSRAARPALRPRLRREMAAIANAVAYLIENYAGLSNGQSTDAYLLDD